MLIRPGETVWRVETARRAALIVDMAAYFKAAREAILKARRSVHLLGWAFDPDTFVEPDREGGGPERDAIGPRLRRLATERPELDVRVLIWRSALPVSASQHFFPHRAKRCFKGSPVRFLLDAKVPFGACHHQKALVVDDALAFAGGGDIAPDRWDTLDHLDHNPHRHRRGGGYYQPRHEVMSVFDGSAARAMGELFRDRWENATGERPIEAPPPDADAPDLWPPCESVDLRDVCVGVARTQPRWRGRREIREVEALHLSAIVAARTTIYMENQYFTSPVLAEALAARLAEPDGPEVVLVTTRHSPSYFDRATMDRTRLAFFQRLKLADEAGRPGGGRLHAFCPVTHDGTDIIVHAKLAFIDDAMMRVGSANINNRSMGFDTECDLAFEAQDGAEGDEARRVIRRLRTHLLAHWLSVEASDLDAELARTGSLGRAIEALDTPEVRRLRPLEPAALGPLWEFVARSHLGDPSGPGDSWTPWTRRAALDRDLARVSARLTAADLPAPAPRTLSDETV